MNSDIKQLQRMHIFLNQLEARHYTSCYACQFHAKCETWRHYRYLQFKWAKRREELERQLRD